MNGGSLGDILQKVRLSWNLSERQHHTSQTPAMWYAHLSCTLLTPSRGTQSLQVVSEDLHWVQVRIIPEDALSAITAQALQGLSYLHRYKHTVSASLLPYTLDSE